MTDKPTIAVLGTGVMGAPMARNLAAAGFALRVWNRTASRAEALAGDAVHVADSTADAVEGADIVLTMLNDGPTVLDAVKSAAPARGTVWLQMSTVGEAIDGLADLARENGLVFVDAPVQGTKGPAENAKLVIMAAGPESVRELVGPVFDAVGARTLWVGEDGTSGAASRLKLVLNTWVIALTHGVGESLAVAEGLGVDPQHFVDVVTGGPMDNGYFQMKSAAILNKDFSTSFSVDNAEKDARLVAEAARRVGLAVDTVQAGQARFRRASEMGHGGEDMAAGYFASFGS